MIKTVEIKNFKQLHYKRFDFEGESHVLIGKNEIGKTTTLEAILWALSGTVFDGTAKESLMNLTPHGLPLDTRTEVNITFMNGNSFAKTFFRNVEENDEGVEIAGAGKTLYSINGGKPLSKASEGVEFIKEQLGLTELQETSFNKGALKGINLISLLTTTNYILSLDNKTLRELIIDIVGDVSVEEIVKKYNETYGDLEQDLIKVDYDINKLRENLRFEIRGDKNNDGLETQVKIKRGVIDQYVFDTSIALDQNEINKAKEEIKELDIKINELKVKSHSKASDLTTKIELDIANLENEKQVLIIKLKEEHELKLKEFENPKLEKEIKTLETATTDLSNEEKQLNVLKNQKNRELEFKKDKLKDLKERLDEFYKQNQQMQLDNKNILADFDNKLKNGQMITCPHCNEVFNINESKEHRLELEKELAIKQEILKGKHSALKVKKDELVLQIETELEPEISKIEKDITKLNVDLVQISKNYQEQYDLLVDKRTKRYEIDKNAPILDLNTKEIETINTNIQTLKTKKIAVLNDYQIVISQYEEEITALENQKQPLLQVANQELVREQALKSLNFVREQYAELTAKLQKTINKYELSKELQIEVFRELERKLEVKMGKDIYVKLYENNVDGSIKTSVCEIYLRDGKGNLTPIINGISTGAYATQMIGFIEKLKEHYELNGGVILLDRLESLDTDKLAKLKTFKSQIITAKVDDNAGTLEVKKL